MDIIQEYYHKKGQLKVIERLRGERFKPCRHSNQLKHYLESQYVSLTIDLETLEHQIDNHLSIP